MTTITCAGRSFVGTLTGCKLPASARPTTPVLASRRSPLIFAVLLGMSVACTESPPATQCVDSAGCDAGSVCNEGTCVKLCSTDNACGGGACGSGGSICELGLCRPGCRDQAPTITSVNGDGSAYNGPSSSLGTRATQHIRTQVILTGVNLSGALVTLAQGSAPFELQVVSSRADELVAALPQGLGAGEYVLSAQNAAGSSQVTTFVLQGEPGPTGASGPAPTEAEIVSVIQGMGTLDASHLGGVPSSLYHTSRAWGRHLEAENINGAGQVGDVFADAGASAGQTRRGDSAVTGDLVFLDSGALGELLAMGPSLVGVRLRLADISGTSAQVDITCEAVRQGAGSAVGVGRYAVIPESLPGTGWVEVAAACAFLPSDTSQRLHITKAAGGSAVFIDRLRIAPSGATSWQRLPLLNGWVPYGGSWNLPEFRVEAGGRVWLRGLVKHDGTPALDCSVDGNLFQLPSGARPALHVEVVVAASGTGVPPELIVRPDGTGCMETGGSAAWIALDSVTFTVD